MRHQAIVGAAAIGLAWAGLAHAGDPPRAEVLFRDAQYLMGQGRHAEACPKLVESQRIDPSGTTLAVLAACYEATEKWASAWETLLLALDDAKRSSDGPRMEFVSEHVKTVAPKVARLTLALSDGARAIAGLTVALDGKDVPPTELGLAQPIDPGRHEIVASATGRTPFHGAVTISTKPDNATLTIPALDAPHRSTMLRTVGFIGIGVGAAGVGVGAVLGGMTFAKKGEADALCGQTTCGSQRGVDLDREAKTYAVGSTIAFIVGGVLATTGVLFVVLGNPNRGAEKTALIIGPAYAGVEGRW